MASSSQIDADGLYAAALRAQEVGRYEDAVGLLGQASEAGHLAAMTLLGAQLLFGRGAPPDPQRGLQLTFHAAEMGGGSACVLAAAITAAGAAGPQDWPKALDYLERAAAGGHAGAQAQLALLADPSGKPAAKDRSWSQLRRAVSLDGWRSAPAFESVMPDPDIRATAGFATPAICDWVIARAQDRLEPAPVFAAESHEKVQSDTRTNSYAGFDLMSVDLVILMLRERMAAAAGFDIAGMEACQALHYAPGETFAPHFDFMDPLVAGHLPSLRARGQRTFTLLVYLNEGYQGGETDFPLIGYRHRGRRGGALLFRNADTRGEPDRRMLHAGLPPTSGEKWVLSQWARTRPSAPAA